MKKKSILEKIEKKTQDKKNEVWDKYHPTKEMNDNKGTNGSLIPENVIIAGITFSISFIISVVSFSFS